MIGYILAAGFGTRLRPLTEHIPKALAPVAGVPILQRQLEAFADAGATAIGVNAHFLPEQMEAFHESSAVAFDLFYEHDTIRGTGGALYFARSFLTQQDIACVRNVDIIASIDLSDLHRRFAASRSACGLVAVPVNTRGSILYEPKTMAYAGTVKEAKGCSGVQRAEFVGIAFYRRQFFDLLTDDDFSVVPLWKRAQNEGLAVTVLLVSGAYWIDIGSPDAYAGVHFDALEGRVNLPVPDTLVIDRQARRAYPAGWNSEQASLVGALSWIEEPSTPLDRRLYRCFVLKGARIDDQDDIYNCIVTPWGRIPLGDA